MPGAGAYRGRPAPPSKWSVGACGSTLAAQQEAVGSNPAPTSTAISHCRFFLSILISADSRQRPPAGLPAAIWDSRVWSPIRVMTPETVGSIPACPTKTHCFFLVRGWERTPIQVPQNGHSGGCRGTVPASWDIGQAGLGAGEPMEPPETMVRVHHVPPLYKGGATWIFEKLSRGGRPVTSAALRSPKGGENTAISAAPAEPDPGAPR